MASGSGAGKWRYKVETETPIAGAISRIGIPDAKSLRAAASRLGVIPVVRPPTLPSRHATTRAAVVWLDIGFGSHADVCWYNAGMGRRVIMTEFGEIEVPGTLYKYRSLAGQQRSFTSSIILKRELWWSPASQLNDEWDCSPLPVLSGSRWAKELAMRRTLRNAFPNLEKVEVKRLASWRAGRPSEEFEASMTKMIEEGRSKIGVCSLSSSPAVSKLWADYADEHRGICLRFDDIAPDSQSNLSPLPHFGLAMRVSYQDDRPRIQVWGRDDGYDKLTKYLLTKTREWEYEEEWRLVDSGFTGSRPFPAPALSGVIFGSAISEHDREDVIKWIEVRKLHVELLQAYVDGPRIEIVAYS